MYQVRRYSIPSRSQSPEAATAASCAYIHAHQLMLGQREDGGKTGRGRGQLITSASTLAPYCCASA
jgi:hypothetical protein